MSKQATNSKRRILVFGGTFDPPHLAHAALPAKAAMQLGCDEILYVPAAINPLKADAPPTPKEHRMAMLLLAIADVPGAKVSAIELERAGPSYTVDTLSELSAQHPNEDLVLLIGADQALDFHRWKDWQRILELAQPAVMLRPPWDRTAFERAVRGKYGPKEADQWLARTLALPMMDLNATDIRKALARGEPVHGLLHPSVWAYIKSNRLYQQAPARSVRE